MEGKTIIKVVGGLAAISTLYAFKKKNDFSKVIEEMTLDIRSINEFKLKGGHYYLNVDIGFHNPTNYDMTAYTAGLIAVKEIKMFYKNKLVGTAISTQGQNKFELPAKGNYVISDIWVQVDLGNILEQLFSTGFDSNTNNYQVHTTIDALGKSWIIEY